VAARASSWYYSLQYPIYLELTQDLAELSLWDNTIKLLVTQVLDFSSQDSVLDNWPGRYIYKMVPCKLDMRSSKPLSMTLPWHFIMATL
jgi:hypothetical protein